MTRSRLAGLVAASPPLLMACFIARLWFSGTLGFYVNDRTIWVVLAGGCLFGVVGAVAVYSAWTDRDGARPSWRTLALLVPIVAGLAVPARPLSGSSAQASSLGSLQLASHVSSGNGGDQFGTWIAAVASHPDPSWWSGKQVTLVGFVSSEAGLPRHSFVLGRYLVTCCVVDATLLGFPVQAAGAPLPLANSWVQVRGVFGSRFWTDPTGQQYPIIQRARLVPVTVPSSPYLSP